MLSVMYGVMAMVPTTFAFAGYASCRVIERCGTPASRLSS